MSETLHLRIPKAVPNGLDRYFEIALYLMLLMGFVTLASTGGLSLPSVLLAGVALAFRGYLLLRGRALLIPDHWTNVLTVSYAAFYLADYFLISRAFVAATVHLVLFVTLVRLFSAKRDRDYYFLAVLSFLMVLAAAMLTVDSMFLAAFAGFMLTGVTAFILMEMRYSSAKASIRTADASDEASRRMAFSLVAAAPLMVLLILLGAAAIFFLLPRMSAGYMGAFSPRNELATGFSDRVELGQIGQIQQSRAVVMHVQVEGDAYGASELKLRGIALNVFDGRTWIDTHRRSNILPSSDGRFTLPSTVGQHRWAAPGQRADGAQAVHYQAVVEPLGTNVFFLEGAPLDLAGNYRQISVDGGGAVFDADIDHPIGRYEAWSDRSRPKPDQLRQAVGAFPPEVLVNYLQLPMLDPRIAGLAAQITVSARNNYDKAAAVEAYLQTHFAYTLQLSRRRPRDPLAEFLFERKQGHCEYFASSMAVMLRTLGIPSRMVNGFRVDEFNDLTSQYVVRESDAHSWVEAYFPGNGWISFDPTPAGPAQAHTKWARLLLYVDAMQSFWRDWVVNYDVQHQAVLGDEAVRSSRQLSLRLRRWAIYRYAAILNGFRRMHSTVSDSPGRWTGVGMLAAGLLVFSLKARQISDAVGQWLRGGRPADSPREAAEIWYQQMTKLLARRGWRKLPTQTPVEFVATIDDDRVREDVERFTTHYRWARFGDFADHARQLPELYRSVVADLSSGNSK